MPRRRQQGFTLIEVLVALLILSFGLLGIANLQLGGVSKSRNSFERSQAILLANEIVERIRANAPGAAGGGYDLASGDTAPTPSSNCLGTSADCSPAELAAADLANWQQRVEDLLVGTDTVIQVTVNGGVATSVALTLDWGANQLTLVAELA
ncbi:MAG: type IV pilus modification protein PilV [Gammaproteobacteria bacterium]|nr:type IV pilus modification protein PilV [Gammaproteobacteria bacterium]